MPVISTFDKTVSNWLKREFWAREGFCRKQVTVNDSAQTLKTGTVLGKTLANGTATGTADAGNTGDGTISSITVGGKAEVGTYTVTIISAATDAGDFNVSDPQGNIIAQGTVGVEISVDGLTFTINDGAADYVVGDAFYIAVDGDVRYKVAVQGASDGSGVVEAIFLGYGTEVEPTVDLEADTDTKVITLTKGPAVVGKSELILDASYDTDAEKDAVYAALEAKGINVDTQL